MQLPTAIFIVIVVYGNEVLVNVEGKILFLYCHNVDPNVVLPRAGFKNKPMYQFTYNWWRKYFRQLDSEMRMRLRR